MHDSDGRLALMAGETSPRNKGPSRIPDLYGLRLLRQRRVQVLAVTLVLGALLAARVAFFLQETGEASWGYDFQAYLQAGERVHEGGSPYSSHQLQGTYSPQEPGLYLYPPFLAAAMAPLSTVIDGYRSGQWLWMTMSALALAASVLAVARGIGIQRGWPRLAVLAGALGFAPVVGELIIGNVHLLLLALLTGAWLALRRGDAAMDRLAGALVGLAVVIKVFPAVLILWFLMTRRMGAAVSALVTLPAIAVLTIPIVGTDAWLRYPTVLLNLGPVVGAEYSLAPTVWLSSALPASWARVVVSVIGLLIVWWTARNRSRDGSFAVAVVVSVLVAPAVYHHYLALLVLPMLIAVGGGIAVPVLVAYVLMSGGEQAAFGELAWVVNRVIPTLGALVLLFALVVRWPLPRESDTSGGTIGAVTARTRSVDSGP